MQVRHIIRSSLPEAGALAAVLLAAVVLWTLAYQADDRLRLAIGGDSESHRREDDAPFLRGFNASEPADDQQWQWWTLSPGYAYRWTRGEASITLPGIGGGRWLVALQAGSGRSTAEPAITTWRIGQQPALNLALPATARVYHFLAPADAMGDLRLHFSTPPYSLAADPRELGFTLREVRVSPARQTFTLPALPHVGRLALVLALVYGLARWLALDKRAALALTLAGALLLALLLATQRMALTLFTPVLPGLALACWMLGLLALLAGHAWSTRRQAPAGASWRMLSANREMGLLIALLLLAFALRAGGMLHPHAIFSDHRLNANNLLELGLGSVYFTEGLPASRGGGHAPYPPGLYLLLAPALLAAPPDIESRVLIVQLGVALLDSLVLPLLWLLLRRAGAGQRAALLGAALYLLPPPMMASFSIGEYANLGGQVLALPVLALLALSSLQRRRDMLLFAVLLSLALLAHMGVAISLVLLLAAAWALSLAATLNPRARPVWPLARLTGGGLLVALFVGSVYYSAPIFTAAYAERLASDSTAASASQPALLPALGRIVVSLFSPDSRILPLLIASGLCGLFLLWQRRSTRPSTHRLGMLLLAWWLGILLSLGLLLIAAQGVRWQHFLYPALCLGAGVALAAFWRRGRAGRLVGLGSVLLLLAHGLGLWVWQLYDYLH
jgi:hypothetical protein